MSENHLYLYILIQYRWIYPYELPLLEWYFNWYVICTTIRSAKKKVEVGCKTTTKLALLQLVENLKYVSRLLREIDYWKLRDVPKVWRGNNFSIFEELTELWMDDVMCNQKFGGE